jgi:hypothetical protein
MSDNHSSSNEALQGSGRTVSDMRVRPRPISFNRMEVSVGTEYERDPTSETSSCDSSVSTTPQGHMAQEVSLNVDLESGPEK